MVRLGCRPIVHITVNRPQRMNTSSIWRERRGKGREKELREGKRGEEKGDHGRSLSWDKGDELQPVGEKLTESVAQAYITHVYSKSQTNGSVSIRVSVRRGASLAAMME